MSQSQLSRPIFIDSAGTSSYHEGEPPDGRMRHYASERGYLLEGEARPLIDKDFEEFDLILTMDYKNLENLLRRPSSQPHKDKITPLTSYCRIHSVTEVPDPYYQGEDGFRLVLDILEDACTELCQRIVQTVATP